MCTCMSSLWAACTCAMGRAARQVEHLGRRLQHAQQLRGGRALTLDEHQLILDRWSNWADQPGKVSRSSKGCALKRTSILGSVGTYPGDPQIGPRSSKRVAPGRIANGGSGFEYRLISRTLASLRASARPRRDVQ